MKTNKRTVDYKDALVPHFVAHGLEKACGTLIGQQGSTNADGTRRVGADIYLVTDKDPSGLGGFHRCAIVARHGNHEHEIVLLTITDLIMEYILPTMEALNVPQGVRTVFASIVPFLDRGSMTKDQIVRTMAALSACSLPEALAVLEAGREEAAAKAKEDGQVPITHKPRFDTSSLN